jgi:hypothetical protein
MNRAFWNGLALLGSAGCLLAGGLMGGEAAKGLSLEVAEADWGGASKADLKAVALSAAGSIWRHCDGCLMPPMILRWQEANPLTAYERDGEGRLQVFVTVRGTYWAQLAFQFGHEFVHAMASHANPPRFIQKGPHANLWFEESLCEVGSLFVLGAMSEAWQTQPPYPNWKGYAAALADYRLERMNREGVRLPEGMDFSTWLAEKLPELRKNATDRDANSVVAAHLLPLFEKHPAGWKAVCWLNAKKQDLEQGLGDYLMQWREEVPEEGKDFVRAVARRMGVEP